MFEPDRPNTSNLSEPSRSSLTAIPCSSTKSQQLGRNDPLEYSNATRLPPCPAQRGATPSLFAVGSIEKRILTPGAGGGKRNVTFMYISSAFYSSQLWWAVSYPQEQPLSSKWVFGGQVLSHESPDSTPSPWCVFLTREQCDFQPGPRLCAGTGLAKSSPGCKVLLSAHGKPESRVFTYQMFRTRLKRRELYKVSGCTLWLFLHF